ncbi:MAG: hypothetical protein JO282_15015, partial [Alphaproteobacteria bacterium]|nr:hypothetical protein [Alphaproteobacteria bacterium]
MKQTIALKLLFAIALALLAVRASAQQPQPVAGMPSFAPNNARTCLTCHGSNPKVMAIFQSPMA